MKILDVAIVGGGVAGTYAAWRIAGSAEGSKESRFSRSSISLGLFEATKNYGGRLLTVALPEMHKAELGGMRFTGSQLLIANLLPELDLSTSGFEYQVCLHYLRGQRWGTKSAPKKTCDTCGIAQGLPYVLSSGETEDPGQLIKLAFFRTLTKISLSNAAPDAATKSTCDRIQEKLRRLSDESEVAKSILTAHEWELLKRHGELEGRPLYQLGFWNVLHRHLSSEAFLLVHDALGYESILANWNAAEAIPWFLADFGVPYFSIDKGFQAVPRALVAQAYERHGNKEFWHYEHLLHRVETIVVGSETCFKLFFAGQEPVFCHSLILALPQRPLLSLVPELKVGTEKERKQFVEDLESVTPHALFKLFLCYEKAWWEKELGVPKGRAVTDMPIRQVYYLDNYSGDSRAMVMASYSDEHYVDFWKPLVNRRGRPAYWARNTAPNSEESELLDAWGVAKPLALKAHRQIDQLHGGTSSIPVPYAGFVRDWSADPLFGAGWHSWKPHTQRWAVADRLSRPFKNLNLFVCGEAFSSEQGWVEGALKSTELALEAMGLGAPTQMKGADYSSKNVQASGFEEYIHS